MDLSAGKTWSMCLYMDLTVGRPGQDGCQKMDLPVGIKYLDKVFIDGPKKNVAIADTKECGNRGRTVKNVCKK